MQWRKQGRKDGAGIVGTVLWRFLCFELGYFHCTCIPMQIDARILSSFPYDPKGCCGSRELLSVMTNVNAISIGRLSKGLTGIYGQVNRIGRV